MSRGVLLETLVCRKTMEAELRLEMVTAYKAGCWGTAAVMEGACWSTEVGKYILLKPLPLDIMSI